MIMPGRLATDFSSNGIYLHLEPGQRLIQTLLMKIPVKALEGEYPVIYEVRDRDHPDLQGSDDMILILRRDPVEENERTDLDADFKPAPPTRPLPDFYEITEEMHDSFLFQVTSSSSSAIAAGEVLYVSALLQNEGDFDFEGTIHFEYPEGWQLVYPGETRMALSSKESKVLIFGIKVGQFALAGDYRLLLELKGDIALRRAIKVSVAAKCDFEGKVEVKEEGGNTYGTVELKLLCQNKGNIPLKAAIKKNRTRL